jgi:hypothetical protein
LDGISAHRPENTALAGTGQPDASPAAPKKKEESAGSDSVTIGANLADHLKNNPMLEKLNALIASALIVSGAGNVVAGIKKGDREQALSGAKQTMWGVYYGLNAVDTVFKTALSLTPGLRMVGGLINPDLGLTKLYKDYKTKGKVDADAAIFNGSAASWGMRHVFLGAEGLGASKWAAGLAANGSKAAKALMANAPLLGVLGMALGLGGGALDAALGVRGIVKGIKTGDKEKKVLGALDVGIGIAMGATCLFTGLPGVALGALGAAGIGYRLWRTDKKMIKETWAQVKEKAHEIKETVKEKIEHLIPLKKEPKAEGGR